MTPEGKVKKAIKEYLDSINIYYELRPAGGVSFKKGLPDMWCVYKGKHIEIEVKEPDGGELSAMQIKWKKRFRMQYGFTSYTVSSVDELKKILQEL